jgi:hypothetical protein
MNDIPYRLPLVIGATGHRDLRDQDIPKLKEKVAEAIKRLKSDYLKSDAETPVIVLSSLAEGADRLIAEVAMDHGAQLIAPLPMPADEYRHDFEPPRRIKPNAAEEFDRLKKLAVVKPVMRYVPGVSDANIGEDSNRALQYREVGIFIVRHCHVLIALWNGNEDETAVGGTAEVVSFKRDGIPLDVTGSARASLDAPEIGPVIHIVTPRDRPGSRVTRVETCPWGKDVVKLYRGGPGWQRWRKVMKFFASLLTRKPAEVDLPLCPRTRGQLEAWETFAAQTDLTCRFNSEAAHPADASAHTLNMEKSLNYLFDDPEEIPEKKLPAAPAKECAMKLVPHWCMLYQIADTLALQRQSQFQWDWRILFGLGFGAIASFEVLTHLAFDKHWLSWLLAAYAALFVGVFAWFLFARWQLHQERFLDYRALAEALRVAVFWKLVGIGWPPAGGSTPQAQSTVDLSSGDSVADAYPIRQPRELDWVKACLRTLELLDAERSPAAVGHNIETDGHAWARNFWVHGQLAFFRRRGPRHEHDANKLLSWSFVFVIVSAGLAGALCLADYGLLGESFEWGHVARRHRAAIFLIGLLPGFAAVMAGYSERLAREAQARQYDRMRALFARAHDLLQSGRVVSFRQIQALYGELGAEAMKETAEWVAIYRQRPLRPP